ncbi:MAG: NHLP leader peptide family RiPP precursor [Rhabdochlamydiaceae bacterium]|nr:NHLP leader peptide family RiPP precursor [Rhabdochlamydiaceae bacterium]
MEKKLDRRQTEAQINVRAWKDPEFKEKLKTDPHAALKEMGMTKIPGSLVIKCAEEKNNQWIIRLHDRPLNFHELSEEVLEKIAAGEPQEASCCPKPI